MIKSIFNLQKKKFNVPSFTNPKRMFIHTLLLFVLPIGKKLLVGIGFGLEVHPIKIFIHFKG